jgi:hypothetical protein
MSRSVHVQLLVGLSQHVLTPGPYPTLGSQISKRDKLFGVLVPRKAWPGFISSNDVHWAGRADRPSPTRDSKSNPWAGEPRVFGAPSHSALLCTLCASTRG